MNIVIANQTSHHRRFFPLVAATWLWIGATGLGANAADYTVIKDLPFGQANANLTLDLYLPPKTQRPAPCVIVIQGGGFLPQNGQRFKPFAEHLARNGFAAALISYRGRPDHQHRDTLSDVKASVRYVRKISSQHGIDPNRIGATGRSAGGTLAALLAVTGDESDPDSQIQAAVCFAGVFDFIGRFTQQQQIDLQPRLETKLKTNGEWIGTPFAKDDREWLEASAIHHVDAKDPPILFLHSRNDSTVPWLQSRDMHRAMEKAGVESQIIVYDTGGHAVKPKDQNSTDDMVRFFREKL